MEKIKIGFGAKENEVCDFCGLHGVVTVIYNNDCFDTYVCDTCLAKIKKQPFANPQNQGKTDISVQNQPTNLPNSTPPNEKPSL